MEKKLPEGWEWKKLGEIGEICSGGTPSTRDETNFDGDIPWITPADLSSFEEMYIEKGKRNISEKGLSSSSAKLLPKNSVIFSSRAPIGYVAIASNPLTTNQGFKNIILKEEILPEYVYYYLKKSKRLVESYASGTTFLEVSATRFSQIPIIIPPLETQQKIVSILEKAEETKKLRAQADQLTQRLLQSVFLEMFGDPIKNSKNWDIEKAQDVISSIDAGWSANGEQRRREENEYAVLKVSAVTQGIFLPEECKVINEDIEFKKVIIPEKGDVLFSRANTLELVGASCLIREDHPYLLLPDKLWKIKVNKEKICPEYFKFVLSHPAIRSEISKRSTGTSGSMYNISMNKLKLIEITVPPIEIQKSFSIIVETIEKIKQSQNQSSLEINNLFDALMQKAFTGELVS